MALDKSPCVCRLHRPESSTDPDEVRTLRNVEEHGVHVLLVADPVGEDEQPDKATGAGGGPLFAYSVGLWHHSRHPEFLVSGQRLDLMHYLVNACAKRVLAGFSVEVGSVAEGLLARYPVTFESVHPEVARELGTWSAWFHRRPVPMLQAVWPGSSGLFGWQTGSSSTMDAYQPAAWRVPGPRQGTLAVEPSWVLPDAPDSLAFVCAHVADDGDPVLYADLDLHQQRGREWSFTCGRTGHETSEIRYLHLQHVVDANPSLSQLGSLPPDWSATRPTGWDRWTLHRP